MKIPLLQFINTDLLRRCCGDPTMLRRIAMLLAAYALATTVLLLVLLTPDESARNYFSHCPPCRFLHSTVPVPTALPVPISQTPAQDSSLHSKRHKLGIVVPYRNRLAELLEFVPHLHQFLTKKQIEFQILVIDQFDGLRFNRGALIDVGFLLARKSGCDYMAMHDVDLLPLNTELNYGYPADGPYHVAAPHVHPMYHYKTFIGGIVLMTNEHFEKVNGLSTRYWGWGREDDELYRRFSDAQLKVIRPGTLSTGTKDTFRHIHNKDLRKRDYKRIGAQKQDQWKRDKITGLSTIESQHKIVYMHNVSVSGFSFTLVNVELICNQAETPWCENK